MKKTIIALMLFVGLAVSQPVQCFNLVDEFGDPTLQKAVLVYGVGTQPCAIRFMATDSSSVNIMFENFLGTEPKIKNIRVRDERGETITISGYYGYYGGVSNWSCNKKEYNERLINLCKMNTTLRLAIDDYNGETFVYTLNCIGFLPAWDNFLSK